MNLYKDRYTLASLVGFVLLLLVGGLWHSVLFAGFYHSQLVPVMRSRALVSFVLLGELAKACVLGYVYPYLAVEEGVSLFKATGKLAVLAVVLGFGGWACMAYGVFGIPSLRWFWSECLFVLFQGVVAAYGIGLAYDFKRLRQAAPKAIQA